MRDGRRLAVSAADNGVISAWWVLLSCDARATTSMVRRFLWPAHHFVIFPDAMASVEDFRELRIHVKAWLETEAVSGASAVRRRSQ